MTENKKYVNIIEHGKYGIYASIAIPYIVWIEYIDSQKAMKIHYSSGEISSISSSYEMYKDIRDKMENYHAGRYIAQPAALNEMSLSATHEDQKPTDKSEITMHKIFIGILKLKTTV